MLLHACRFASGNASKEEVKERQERSMADPEVQGILKDPVMQVCVGEGCSGGGRGGEGRGGEALRLTLVSGGASCRPSAWHCPLIVLLRNYASMAPNQCITFHRTSLALNPKPFPSVLQNVLRDFQENPKAAQKHLTSPEIMVKINKLVAAGIIQMK